MKKSPGTAATAASSVEHQKDVEARSQTFVFPSAPPAPSEYAFIDGDLSNPSATSAANRPIPMPRNGAVAGSPTNRPNRPPPPYVFGRISSHVYDMIDPKSGHEWMFRVALIEFLFAVLAISTSISCVVEVGRYCPFYTGVWVSIIFLANAALGIAAAKWASVNLFVAHLVTSVLAAVSSIILLALSVHNWNDAGYKTGELCVFARHDVDHLRGNVWHNQKYPYAQCVYDFKLGLTFNAILMICAVLEGALSLASTIFCFRAVCHCSQWRHRR